MAPDNAPQLWRMKRKCVAFCLPVFRIVAFANDEAGVCGVYFNNFIKSALFCFT